jgi:hypothetical protein
MRILLAGLFLLLSLSVQADEYLKLYQVAGWPQQRANFTQALEAAQLRYRDTLPPALYQTLVDSSNRRFAAQAMDQRALDGLRSNLTNPEPALQFFKGEVGSKVVTDEIHASRGDQLAIYSQGLPRSEAGAERRQLISALGKALPASEVGAEVGLALASVAADSLSEMLPGVLGADQTQGVIDSQRERLQQQINNDLDNTLLHIYRNLSDAELKQFVSFAQSPEGQDYYRAAMIAVRAAMGSKNSAVASN